jgi:hypothetical protein
MTTLGVLYFGFGEHTNDIKKSTTHFILVVKSVVVRFEN